MKKTMAEVAANIESRVTYEEAKRMIEDKASRSDIQFQLQHRPSFDDHKQIIEQIHMSPQQEMIEEELAKLRMRVDELSHKAGTTKNTSANTKELSTLSQGIESRFADLEEKLNDKANKQSVA